MSKTFVPTPARPGVLTANDLRAGHSVWRDAAGDWTTDPRAAALFTDEADADLALLAAMGQSDRVVGPYVVEAKPGPHGPEPTHFREAFRQHGPTNYPAPTPAKEAAHV